MEEMERKAEYLFSLLISSQTHIEARVLSIPMFISPLVIHLIVFYRNSYMK